MTENFSKHFGKIVQNTNIVQNVILWNAIEDFWA